MVILPHIWAIWAEQRWHIVYNQYILGQFLNQNKSQKIQNGLGLVKDLFKKTIMNHWNNQSIFQVFKIAKRILRQIKDCVNRGIHTFYGIYVYLSSFPHHCQRIWTKAKKDLIFVVRLVFYCYCTKHPANAGNKHLRTLNSEQIESSIWGSIKHGNMT